jgi:tetratricopeptide (TPR) repeat protein
LPLCSEYVSIWESLAGELGLSEETERAGSGPEGNGAGIDPVAVALAMAGASRERADAFLKDQQALIAAQLHHLHEQLKQIHLDIFEKWLGAALKLATLCVGIAAATGVALMVWDAAHSNGLLIEPFSVPPDMAAKGLTGQAIASQVQDKLTEMQSATQSFRPARSYANNWGNDIKVEIPETGVSIGEFRRFLRDWLGHDTHISGEVWHTDSGLAISARTSGERGATYAGRLSDLDSLVEKAAEHVYAQTQPYRYANYLRGQYRLDEARAIFRRLTASGSPEEEGWAWQGLATLPGPRGSSDREAAAALRRAVAVYPDYTMAHISLAGAEANMGHAEAALAEARTGVDLLGRSTIPDVDPAYLGTARASWPLRSMAMLGDFAQVISLGRSGLELPDQAAQHELMRLTILTALAQQHDGPAAREFFRDLPPGTVPTTFGRRAVARLRAEAATENWETVLALAPPTIATVDDATKHPSGGTPFDRRDVLLTQIYPWVALAKAKLGDVSGAEAAVGATPADCYDCLRVRGAVAAEARQWDRAGWWFARAAHDGSSLPFAYADWGNALLARGKPDDAIAQFTIANKKGPHFADPIEGWGEALMAKNQSHLALAKFAEADKYAPNWGRLHLKWGEALYYAGKKDEAQKQFARAAALDLTPTEKSELARHSIHV